MAQARHQRRETCTMAADWDDDEPLGYGKPPMWTRFRKGQSGNPTGRPRKRVAKPAPPSQSEYDDILRAELDRPIKVTEGNTTKELSMRAVIIKSRVNNAAKGNVHAQRDMVRAICDLEVRDAERKAAARAQAESDAATERLVFEYIVAWREERRAVWVAAAPEGREPEQPWPHPDDILIDHETQRWRPRGPWGVSCVQFYESVRAERDYYFATAALARRSRDKASRQLAKFWDTVWVSFDVLLPLRWQVSSDATLPMWFMMVRPIGDLRAELRIYAERAATLRLATTGRARTREEYHFVNTIMRPLLKRMGYRSLAQLERAHEGE